MNFTESLFTSAESFVYRLHAHDEGLTTKLEGAFHYKTRPVKGKVLKGSYAGEEFLLIGTKEIVRFGFSQNNVNACCKGHRLKHLCCEFSYATETEIKNLPRGLSRDVIEDLSKLSRQGVKI